jgi:hypothetical protein
VTPAERRDPDESDVDAAFAQIIAGWEDEAKPQWPAEEDVAVEDATPTEELPAAQLSPAAQEPEEEEPAVVDADEDHFVPPEPPPLPRPQPATVGAVGLFLLGIVLLAIPNMIGFSEQYGLPLGLLSITGAIVWLAARLRQGPPTDSGWDDGAQV